MKSVVNPGSPCTGGLALVGPETAPADLVEVMARGGFHGDAVQFIESVTAAYRAAEHKAGFGDMTARFRREASHAVFVEGLKIVAARLTKPARMLVLGCSSTFVGCDASYAEEMVREHVDRRLVEVLEVRNIDRTDLRPRDSDDMQYDCVVSHSLLHFVPELPCLLHRIQEVVRPGGLYLMAHEPNSRYWSEPALMEARRRFLGERARRTRVSRYFEWWAWSARFKRIVTPGKPHTFDEIVNHHLRSDSGLTGSLTHLEIARLVDPHRCSEISTGFRIGLNGLDPQTLQEQGFQRLVLEWQTSYDHLGATDYSVLDSRWKLTNAGLAANHPHDGSAWTALWTR